MGTNHSPPLFIFFNNYYIASKDTQGTGGYETRINTYLKGLRT